MSKSGSFNSHKVQCFKIHFGYISSAIHLIGSVKCALFECCANFPSMPCRLDVHNVHLDMWCNRSILVDKQKNFRSHEKVVLYMKTLPMQRLQPKSLLLIGIEIRKKIRVFLIVQKNSFKSNQAKRLRRRDFKKFVKTPN